MTPNPIPPFKITIYDTKHTSNTKHISNNPFFRKLSNISKYIFFNKKKKKEVSLKQSAFYADLYGIIYILYNL